MPGKIRKATNLTFVSKVSPSDVPLDALNLKLLGLLADDPRLTMAELGRRVGMSPPAVAERVQRLHEAGIIRGCHLDLDPRRLGLGVTAYVRVRPMPGALPKIAALAQATPEVVECHRVTGEDCFLMKVHVIDLQHMERVLDAFLAHGNTTTSIVQSSPVPHRPPPFPVPPA